MFWQMTQVENIKLDECHPVEILMLQLYMTVMKRMNKIIWNLGIFIRVNMKMQLMLLIPTMIKMMLVIPTRVQRMWKIQNQCGSRSLKNRIKSTCMDNQGLYSLNMKKLSMWILMRWL